MNKAQQPDYLRLRINPTMVTLLAIIFLVIGGVLQPIGKSQTFECSRTTPDSGSCTLSHKELGLNRQQTFPLTAIREVKLATSQDEMGKKTYAVQVITDTELIWLGDQYSSDYDSHKQVYDQVNIFMMDTSQTSLVIKQKSSLVNFVIGALFALMALAMLLFSSRVTLDLDRNTGLATLLRKSLVQSRKIEIPLAELTGAEVQVAVTRNERTYRVALIHRDGQRTPLTNSHSSGAGKKQELADMINHFLRGR